ncbi:hypothetical protein [Waddlia chondrophila]|uniref:Uncharacterized protein n=1 Tax=Waddlia chondrophila (strain ATCC VR-1470 / WSU 86-1044) TaxID=716544 RepID=D6YV19_WADCW|nr:hypothetical protein [Waddlia chondrophila]ADI37980.1 hypothetical protein wcw_0612 [Waddlia chondrophila WSU 86-1044]
MATSTLIHSISYDFKVVGSLRENERLLTNGRKFSKLQAPDRFFKNSQNPLLKLLHKIVTLALKILQALERAIRGEQSEINLHNVEELTHELSTVLENDLLLEREGELYTVLKDLGHLSHSLHQSVSGSLENYKTTLLSRSACVDASSMDDEAWQMEKFKKITDQVANEILPKLGRVIEGLESKVAEEDRKQSEKFFSQLFSKDPLDLDIRVSAKSYTEILKSKFGVSAVERALRDYELEYELALSGSDMAALAIGVVAHFKEEDLKEYIPLFDQESEEALCWQLIDLRSSMNPHVFSMRVSKPYRCQLEHDQKFLQYVNDIEDWVAVDEHVKSKGLKHYSYAEYLSRHIIYALFSESHACFPDGLLVPMYDEANALRLMTVHQLVSVKGLHGALFKSFRPVSEQNKMHVVFRGTYCRYSILRDISPTETMQNRLFDGPGRYSFTKHQENIYDKILEHASSVPHPVFEFGGHSLGASDAMRAMEYFMYRQAESVERFPLTKFVLNAFNTPGIEPDVSRRFMQSLKILNVETDLRYFDVHHDIVQELGAVRLGYWRSDETRPDFLKISIFKFNRRVEERLVALARNFFKKMSFNLKQALEAHTFYCLKLHDTENPKRLNDTFIQEILSNHPDDLGVSYGKEGDKKSELASDDQLSDSLLTTSCRIGRKLKQMSKKVATLFHRLTTFRATASHI